jgi:small subunit ribosomal protein S16
MRVAAPKADKKALFEAAAKEAESEPKPASAPKKRAEKAEKKAEAPKAEETPAEAPAAESAEA